MHFILRNVAARVSSFWPRSRPSYLYRGGGEKTQQLGMMIDGLIAEDWFCLNFTFHTFVTYTEACGKAGWSQEEEGDWVRENNIQGHAGRVEFTLYSYLNQNILLFCLIIKRKSLTDKNHFIFNHSLQAPKLTNILVSKLTAARFLLLWSMLCSLRILTPNHSFSQSL